MNQNEELAEPQHLSWPLHTYTRPAAASTLRQSTLPGHIQNPRWVDGRSSESLTSLLKIHLIKNSINSFVVLPFYFQNEPQHLPITKKVGQIRILALFAS